MSETKKTITASSMRAYTMILALGVIWVFFYWLTGGTFLTAGNLSNLALQTSVTGVIAVGMLMVIVSGNIDLSVGSVLGFAGGIAAYSMANLGYGIVPSIVFAIVVGIAIGLLHGTLTAYFNIPAFIVTLGGLLAWRGAVKWLLEGNTIPISSPTYRLIGGGFIGSTNGWILAGIAVIFLLFMAYQRAQAVKNYGLGEANYGVELLKTIVPIGLIIAFIYIMNSNVDTQTGIPNGVPIAVLIMIAVAFVGSFITNSTTFGRYLYAIGGNADAAKLSGINNKANILKVYALLGALTGLAAVISTARLGSATTSAGTLKELDAIAACVIGGASLVGGRGTIFGALIGALIMTSLDNGMSIYNVKDYMQDIVKGSILVLAVGADMFGRKN